MVAKMSADLIDQFADKVAAVLGPKLLAFFKQNGTGIAPDKLLSIPKAAKQLGISETKLRELVDVGAIMRAPGITEIRIRQSELDSYGKPERKGKI